MNETRVSPQPVAEMSAHVHYYYQTQAGIVLSRKVNQ